MIYNKLIFREKQQTFENIQIRLATENEFINAVIEKIDNELDLAIIKIEENIVKPVLFGKSSITGEKIFTMGNAQNYGISIMEGIIANNNVKVEADGRNILAIQCDLNITEGNSGGALFNKKGELIGITTFRLKDSHNNVIYGISFAIPLKTILNFIK